MNPSPVTVVLVVIPPCVLPIPASPMRNNPSTNTSSPTAKGSITNPFVGVSIKQVIIPALGKGAWIIELIPTPLELLIAIILWFTESRPLIGATISTSETVWFGVIACNDESSITVFDTGLNNNKLGALE